VFEGVTANDIELLNSYQLLGVNGKKELKDYMRYLLCKQYRRELMVAIFQNQLIHNLCHSVLHIIEKDDFDIDHLGKRIRQIKELYYGTFEQVHYKYSEHIENLDSIEVVREFGKNSFGSIERALRSEDQILIRVEIIDFYEEFKILSLQKEARKIAAV
jgi:hypothetical protein